MQGISGCWFYILQLYYSHWLVLFVWQGPKSLRWSTRLCLSWFLLHLSLHYPSNLYSFISLKAPFLPSSWELCISCFLYLNCSSLGLYLFNACFPGDSDSKESSCNTGHPGSIPGSGRSPGEGSGYWILEYSMDRRIFWATVYGVAKSWTWLSN